MRPRVFPAEDFHVEGLAGVRGPGFNEAAGIPRGRPAGVACAGRASPHASMRPRVFPAEDSRRRARTPPRLSGFNEAAGIPRGRHFEYSTIARLEIMLQ